MKSFFSITMLMALISSCSIKKKEQPIDTIDSGIELTDAVDVSEQSLVEDSDEDLFDEKDEAEPEQSLSVEDATNELETSPVKIQQTAMYEVRKNETLMIIAFNYMVITEDGKS